MAQSLVERPLEEQAHLPMTMIEHLPLVLIIEDDAGVRDCLQMMLLDELPNVRLRSTATIHEAERIATAMHPDLLICDIRLPDGDGRTLLSRLRRQRGLAHTPALLLTVLDVTDPTLREDAASLHAKLIAKPFDVPMLLDQVINALLA